MGVVVGASGWQYKSWKNVFYDGVKQSDWLRTYAANFETVEVNNSFYRLPSADGFKAWREETSRNFLFAVKMSRYLTHVKRLNEPDEPVQRFLEHARPLGKQLGPVLIQLPPTLQRDTPRLQQTLAAFPKRVRVAVEFRHPSWFDDEVRRVLGDHGAACCLTDGGVLDAPHWRTADWAYMRFHSGNAQPESCYTKPALNKWARRLTDMWTAEEDVYVYFNNDAHACALRNAAQFADSVAALGRPITATPAARKIPLS